MTVHKLMMVVDGEKLEYGFTDDQALQNIVSQVNEGGHSFLQLNDGKSIALIKKSAVTLMKVWDENIVTPEEAAANEKREA